MVYSTSSSFSSLSSLSKAQDKTKASFQRRQLTVMKKAQELSTLCGIEVAVICYGPDGELQTWPRNMSKVREMAEKYVKCDETGKRKKTLNLSEFLGKTKRADEEKKNKGKKGFDVENPKLDGLSAEELSELGGFLDRKMKTLQERLRFLETLKHKTASPSGFKDDQSINFCPINQEIYQPASSSDFADMALIPLGFHENPQFSASTVNQNYTSYDNFGFSSVPGSYNSYIPHLSQEPASNSDFADMVLPLMDLHGNPQLSVYDGSYASFDNGPVPCSYNNYAPHVIQDPIPLMSYGDCHNSSQFMGMELSGHDFHSQFPQMMLTAYPLQQLGPHSAAASMGFGV